MGELFCPCPELLHLRLLEGKREEGRKRLFPKDPLRGRMGGRRAGGGRADRGRGLQAAGVCRRPPVCSYRDEFGWSFVRQM